MFGLSLLFILLTEEFTKSINAVEALIVDHTLHILDQPLAPC